MPTNTPEPQQTSTQTQPQTSPREEERPRPAAADSGGDQGGGSERSADDRGSRPGTPSPPDDLDREKLRKRVEETEAWVQRLKTARAEGTRLSQEQKKAPTQTPPKPDLRNEQPASEIDEIVAAINSGDDRAFAEAILNASEKRHLNRTAVEEGNRELVKKVTSIVEDHAPDVPMSLFWAFTEDAIRLAPNDIASQVEIAIKLSRRELEARDKRLEDRRNKNEENRRDGDTLAPSRDRPRGASEPDDDKRTMTDDLRAFQRSMR